MISGFYVNRGTTGNTAKWSPSGNPVNLYRSRIAVRIAPPPWGLVSGDTLNLLLPKLSGSGETTKLITFTGSVPTTAQQLVDYINGLRLGTVEAILAANNAVDLVVLATVPFIQVIAHRTTVMSKFQLHTDLIVQASLWELIATIDPSGQTDYDSFEDSLGLPTDLYKLMDTSGDVFTPIREPLKILAPGGVCCLEGTLLNLNGTARQGIKVSLHEVPPSEPEGTEQPGTPLLAPGWPVNVLTPLEVIPPATRGKFWQEVVTDENGFFSVVCTRGHRIFIEIHDLGWSAILDIPDATFLDIQQLSSWRRTGLLGMLDTVGSSVSDLSTPGSVWPEE